MNTTGALCNMHLRVPEFWCPITGAEHPGSELYSANAARWMTDLRIWADPDHGSRLAGYEIGRLVALTAPRALPEHMQVAVDLNVWYHALDDAIGDAGLDRRPLEALIELMVGLDHALTAPEDPACDADPFTAGLADICRRVAAIAARDQYAEWLGGIRSYLLHELSEAAWRESEAVPSLERYAVYCTDGRAAAPSMLLLPVLGGYQIPHEQMTQLRALTRLTCLLACLDNDLYSLPKEADQVGHVSLPKLIALEESIGMQQALEEAMAVRDVVMAEFLAASRRLTGQVPGAGARYVEDLGSWIAGQLAWGLSSPRFARDDALMPRSWARGPRPADPQAQQRAARLLSAAAEADDH